MSQPMYACSGKCLRKSPSFSNPGMYNEPISTIGSVNVNDRAAMRTESLTERFMERADLAKRDVQDAERRARGATGPLRLYHGETGSTRTIDRRVACALPMSRSSGAGVSSDVE